MQQEKDVHLNGDGRLTDHGLVESFELADVVESVGGWTLGALHGDGQTGVVLRFGAHRHLRHADGE